MSAQIDPSTIDAALRGVRNIAWVTIHGVHLPVRAIAEGESDDVRALAHSSALSRVGAEPHTDLVEQIADRYVLARTVLDPLVLHSGRHRPFFAELGDLEALDVEAAIMLAQTQRVAQQRAMPRLKADEMTPFHEALQARAKTRWLDQIRATAESAARFYDIDSPRQVTGWQAVYFAALAPH